AAEGDDAKADKIAAEIQAAIKDGTFTQQFDPEKEKKNIRIFALKNMFRSAEVRNQNEKAEEYAKQIKELDPSFDVQELRNELALHKAVSLYFQAISGQESSADYKKLGEELAPKLKKNPEVANNISWAILTGESI
ncbi:MAG TPA: hypothetical protein VM735_09175, partial [Candidatus Kapabacteria bacterium]|nr:hypothetical protein [Candidatus Kapabacteria bacterium]